MTPGALARRTWQAIQTYLYREHPRPALPAPRPTGFPRTKVLWGVGGVVLGVWLGTVAPVPGITPQAQAMLGVATVMVVWWLTEAIPVAATALLPLAAFPLLGIADARQTAAPYADPNVFLFLGGFILATGMQRWNLHRRLALWILLRIGSEPHRLVLGFMVATGFLSMWVSNTATVLMMFPIATALVDRAEGGEGTQRERFATCLLLAIAYGSSTGGMATLIGTPPNIVFAGMYRRLVPGVPEVSFLEWMALGLPIAVVMMTLTYLVLTRVAFRFDAGAFQTDAAHLRQSLQSMGPMGGGEWGIAVVFTTTAVLWLTRQDLALGAWTLPGWGNLLPFGHLLHDGTVAMAMSLLLFLIPADRRQGLFLMDRDWYQGLRWDIILLFGGGLALAEGVQASGLSDYLGARLAVLTEAPLWLTLLGLCLFISFLTEFISNTAATTVMLPILAACATAAGQPPALFMLPATFAASAAFMLPVATPPNAVVFAGGHITIRQMAGAGLVLKLLAAPIVAAGTYWLGRAVLGY